jgi:hypothetical protein
MRAAPFAACVELPDALDDPPQEVREAARAYAGARLTAPASAQTMATHISWHDRSHTPGNALRMDRLHGETSNAPPYLILAERS